MVKDGSAHIRVVSCPPALWGVISQEKTPGRDTNNPEPALRSRPMLGVPILMDMKPTSANLWSGKIYDARGGSFYDAKISVNKSDKLEVRGCAIGGMFCGGEDWSRIPSSSPEPVPVAPATRVAPKTSPKAAAKGAAAKPVDYAKDPDPQVCSAILSSTRPAH
jgi:hypothetical protein